MRAAFMTLGCKVNHYETQAMQELFQGAGWEIVPFSGAADLYLINTCTVTAMSDAKSRQMIAKAHAKNPGALIAAVGCYAQAAAETLAALPGVGLVVGTEGRKNIVSLVDRALAADNGGIVEVASPRSFEPLSAVKDGRTRATLKIQDGCTNFCSYCIIPYVRGPLRSRPLEDVERELYALAGEGYREVVLSGIHLSSYGRDLGGVDLMDVLSLTRRIEGIERVRLGSLEPGFVDERFAAAVAENGKVCDQFHLSLQSGSTTVLARMKRRYTPEAFAHSVRLLRQALPNCAITTDLIAGFPGETDTEHKESLAFCEGIGFSRMHVFPYSARPGTAAAAMPDQVPRATASARARALIACGETLRRQYLQEQLGKTLAVLVEQDGIGFAANYVPVRAGGRAGEIRLAKITGMDKDILIGEEA